MVKWTPHRTRPLGVLPQIGAAVIAVGAVLVAVAAAKATTTLSHGVSTSHPDQSLLNFGVGVVIAGLVVIALVLLLAFGRWVQAQFSPLSIDFDPERFPACRESFSDGKQTRVRVKNQRNIGIERVRLMMTRVVPAGYESFAHRIHDFSNAKESSKTGYDLAPDEPVYFDIAWLDDVQLILEYAEDHVKNLQRMARPLPAPEVVVTLTATGWQEGWAVKPRSKHFHLTIDDHAQLVSLDEIKNKKDFDRLVTQGKGVTFSGVDYPNTAASGPTD